MLKIIILSGINIGISMRFWYSVMTPPPPLTIDWSPAIYWLLGIVIAALAIHVVRRNRTIINNPQSWILLSLNGIVFVGYFAVVIALFAHSLLYFS